MTCRQAGRQAPPLPNLYHHYSPPSPSLQPPLFFALGPAHPLSQLPLSPRGGHPARPPPSSGSSTPRPPPANPPPGALAPPGTSVSGAGGAVPSCLPPPPLLPLSCKALPSAQPPFHIPLPPPPRKCAAAALTRQQQAAAKCFFCTCVCVPPAVSARGHVACVCLIVLLLMRRNSKGPVRGVWLCVTRAGVRMQRGWASREGRRPFVCAASGALCTFY